MSVQVIYQAPTAISFPRLGGGGGPAGQLRRLFYSTPAGLLIGWFEGGTTDYELNTGPGVWDAYGAFARLWRDGTRLTWTDDPALSVHTWPASRQPYLAATDAGTLAWAPEASPGNLVTVDGALLTSYTSAHVFYRVNDVWPMDLHTGEALNPVSHLLPQYVGVLRPTISTAYSLLLSHAGSPTTPALYENPGTTVRWTGPAGHADYRRPRDLLYLDARTVAGLWMQQTAGSIDPAKPAIIRVFDTSTSAWTVTWEDVLPGSAHVAAWDPVHRLLYATGRYASNATLYLCRLARAPVAVAVPTLVGASALRELTATRLSTLLTDARGSAISQYVVRWTLSASLSGGALDSAYSRTNASGGATITYVGPRGPPAGLTEAVTAAVSDVEG